MAAKLARVWWVFLILAVAIGAWGVASAQSTPAVTYGPDWGLIAKWLASVLLGGVAFYAKALEGRVTKIEAAFGALQRSLDRDYHVKADIDRMLADHKADRDRRFDKVDTGFRELHERLDLFNVPRGRRLRTADEE